MTCPRGTELSSDSPLKALSACIAADPGARFAISLDRLAYANDNHRLGSDLVRTFVRNVDRTTLTGQLAHDVATLQAGMRVLTGRAEVLGRRYGELAVAVRERGGTLFDFESDAWAREITARIGLADAELACRIAERSAAWREDTVVSGG
ncbi:hypothetical protein A5N17_06700 [Arthrobacter sp. D2]|nr:hypothetical protein [Arthrobacter sp. M5]NKR17146.1 hypothetical protein [Arthrobacter sp. M6]OEH61826.1 hypothetical protein A5N13_15720 [Arthrobacter sp. D4]OEH64128.1 hypothetical protein A5N17_06700 [Arthrobacter sp. D2]